MALQKQPVWINFAKGLNTKVDPFQLSFDQFLSLKNSVFTKTGRLTKRNGYGTFSQVDSTNYLTTFSGNLTAIGSKLQAYNAGSKNWINKGAFRPVSISTMSTARSALNQIQCDSVIASNNLLCTVYTETDGSTTIYKYVIEDSKTGQNISGPSEIPVTSGSISGSARVFLLGGYFVIVFTNTISATDHLQFVAISISNPSIISNNEDIAASYIPSDGLSWDGVVVNNKLYVAYNTTSGGQQIEFTYLDTNFNVATPTSFSGEVCTLMGVSADNSDPSNPIIYASYYDSNTDFLSILAIDAQLNERMSPTQITNAYPIDNVTLAVTNGIAQVIFEVDNDYPLISIPTHFLNNVSITLPATVTTGTVGSINETARSVGLASKAFVIDGSAYILTTYQSDLQSTYFLMDINGNVVSRFAYENGGGYLDLGLPFAQVFGNEVNISYLYKDLIQGQNTQGLAESIGPAGFSNIYSQTGINLLSANFTTQDITTSEIGNNLNITGGMLWAYDGQTLNEQGFNLFPDDVQATWSTSGGSIHAQPDGSTNTDAYYYQVVYQWTDLQGNIIQSAPSIPVAVTTTGSGTSGSIELAIPTIRLTYKPDVKIMIYRWSVANQIYYQVTSVSSPTLNDPTVDSISYTDTLADSSIVGNSIIYTTGGVVENTPGPATNAITLFDDRLWYIEAEDPNVLGFSKQVIEGTPVEISDLFTLYVAPSTGAQGSTGPSRCIFPMDDKLIIFKDNAIYYINGVGPDNTGANNGYIGPIFVTSSVGCSNQNSIVLIPNGLMFQSNKGIWLLGRDLSTRYIGAPVEDFNSININSATSIPGTTQVRFTLDNGVILMYDYFYDQWGEFDNSPAISSTLYNNLHTYISDLGNVSQETPSKYFDNGNPVLMSFKTAWLNLAGIIGYQRAYTMFLLGEYLSPHLLNIGLSYNYNSSIEQVSTINPTNFSSSVPSPFGIPSAPFGASDAIESWRVFFARQRCSSIQISFNEVFDPTLGVPAGEGLTLSGINVIVGLKKGYRTISAEHSVGGGQNRG